MKSVLSGMGGGILAVLVLAGFIYLFQEYGPRENSGQFDASWAEHDLRDLVLKIESYRLVFGAYPDSLNSARGGWGGADSGASGCKCRGDYYYSIAKGGEAYFLFSKGPDCTAFTQDDIHPNLPELEKAGAGLTLANGGLASNDEESCNDT